MAPQRERGVPESEHKLKRQSFRYETKFVVGEKDNADCTTVPLSVEWVNMVAVKKGFHSNGVQLQLSSAISPYIKCV